MTGMPRGLRARLEADYAPVRPLPPPWLRVLWVMPLAILTLVAASMVFSVRPDADRLGWLAWGASLFQAAAGLALIAASLRESIPGRQWRTGSLTVWLTLPAGIVAGVTLASWEASQVALGNNWWLVGAMCLFASASSALPVVALAGVLSARAFATRPVIAGALLGLGAGLIADAGWRMFCHFTEPAHVLSAHLGGVMMATVIGSLLSIRLTAFAKATALKKADTTIQS